MENAENTRLQENTIEKMNAYREERIKAFLELYREDIKEQEERDIEAKRKDQTTREI